MGALLAVALFVAGQMLASLLLDGQGWLGVEREPLTAAAVLGGAAVVAGAWLIAGTLRAHGAWTALGVAAGAALPVQGAVNAQLRADVDAPVAAALVSFLVATAAMAVVLAAALSLGATARPRVAPLRGMPWWGWLGGAVGATYVTSVFLLMPEIGAAPTIGLTVAGQQLASLLVDRHGLLRLPRRPITARRLAGVAVLLAGVALVQVG